MIRKTKSICLSLGILLFALVMPRCFCDFDECFQHYNTRCEDGIAYNCMSVCTQFCNYRLYQENCGGQSQCVITSDYQSAQRVLSPYRPVQKTFAACKSWFRESIIDGGTESTIDGDTEPTPETNTTE